MLKTINGIILILFSLFFSFNGYIIKKEKDDFKKKEIEENIKEIKNNLIKYQKETNSINEILKK